MILDNIIEAIGSKKLTKLKLVAPASMLIASYIAQTGMEVHFWFIDIQITSAASVGVQLFQAITILMLKSIPVLVVGGILLGLFVFADVLCGCKLIPVISIFPLAFGFLSIFASSEVPSLIHVHKSWSYTAFVVGLCLLSISADVEKQFTTLR